MNKAWSLLAAVVAVVQMQAVLVDALYQGDIILTDSQRHSMEANANQHSLFAPQHAVVKNQRSLWPNAVVPYIFDNSLNTRARNAIQEAIDSYNQLSCVRFIDRTTESDYVRFFQGQGCYSYIGRVSGPQDISIGRGCEYKGIVMHEMFHALGRYHEQSRPDRDMYIKIDTQNIESGKESNFRKTSTAYVTTQGVPYDFGSVMHYGAFAFSRNRQPTIEPVNVSISLNSLGQRKGLSPFDIKHVNTLYKCGGTQTISGSWSQWQSWTSCSQTCNGGTRTRTRRCIGGTDCPGSNIDTHMCNGNPCPVPASWGTWTQWGDCSATCGGGRQERIRSCVGGNNCIGNNAMFRDCNTQSCPLPATWGPWGSWSTCSATCQGGLRDRTRRCQNGNTCTGRGTETQFCNSNILCTSTPNPNTGEWSQWTQCTKTCGGGDRFRSRMCGARECQHERQLCNTNKCDPEPNLRGLKHEGCYFLPRFSSTLLLLDGHYPTVLDYAPNRTEPIRKCGMATQLNTNTIFGVTIGYCISGSNRLADYETAARSNLCVNGVGNYNAQSNSFVMDVYTIMDPNAFRDSVSQVAATANPSSGNTDAEVGVNSNIAGNGGAVISTSFRLLLSIVLITFFFVLHVL